MTACRLRALDSPIASTLGLAPAPRIVGSNRANANSHSNTRPTSLQNQPSLSRAQHQQSLPRQQSSVQPNGTAARAVAVRQRSAANAPAASKEDAKYRDVIMAEVLDVKPAESWDDIAGLDGAKQVSYFL